MVIVYTKNACKPLPNQFIVSPPPPKKKTRCRWSQNWRLSIMMSFPLWIMYNTAFIICTWMSTENTKATLLTTLDTPLFLSSQLKTMEMHVVRESRVSSEHAVSVIDGNRKQWLYLKESNFSMNARSESIISYTYKTKIKTRSCSCLCEWWDIHYNLCLSRSSLKSRTPPFPSSVQGHNS